MVVLRKLEWNENPISCPVSLAFVTEFIFALVAYFKSCAILLFESELNSCTNGIRISTVLVQILLSHRDANSLL